MIRKVIDDNVKLAGPVVEQVLSPTHCPSSGPRKKQDTSQVLYLFNRRNHSITGL